MPPQPKQARPAFTAGYRVSRSLVGLAAAGLALLALAATAARADVEEEAWAHFESDSFRLLSNAEVELSTQILLDLERFRRAFAQLAPGLDSSFPVPTQIVAFGDAESYAPFKSESDSANTRILGQFLGHRDGNFITLNADPRMSGGLGIVIHEYVHHVVNQNLPGVPRWLNEGLAEYYSTFRVEDGFAMVGGAVDRHLNWWRRNPDISVLEVLGEPRNAPVHSLGDAGRYYAVSWGLTHYLLSTASGTDSLASYLEEVAAGADRSEALLAVLGVSRRELEALLRSHVAAESLPANRLALDELGKMAIEQENTSPAATLVVLGELAARLGNEQHAEELLSLALGYEPESAEALAGLASLREGQGRLEEAGLLYDDALALAPGSALPYLRYGRHLLRRRELVPHGSERAGELAIEAKVSFLAAAGLEPSFAEPRVMLAFVHQLDGLEAEEGLVHGKRARELLPTRVDVVHILIRLYLKQGSIDRANALLEGPLAALAEPEFKEKVRDEIERAELLLAARAALSEGRWDEGLELFDQAISYTVDAEARLQMEEQLAQLEQRAERAKGGAGAFR